MASPEAPKNASQEGNSAGRHKDETEFIEQEPSIPTEVSLFDLLTELLSHTSKKPGEQPKK